MEIQTRYFRQPEFCPQWNHTEMQWCCGPKENYIYFKDIFTFRKTLGCDRALYLASLLQISTGTQPISEPSAGTKCLTVISFDAVCAACRVCVKNGINWVCIITNCCKGNPWKWRHLPAVRHTLKGDKHTLCCHLFKVNWMTTLLQQQPFFILKHEKSPSPAEGEEQTPVLHAVF